MYTLHYAPDTASLVVRLVLEELGVPYRARAVDTAADELNSPAYRKLNPFGLIPVLETPDGPIFETGAIVLWLSETHGALAPRPGDPQRAAFLKWLFFVSNTLHPDLARMFHPTRHVGPDKTAQEDMLEIAAVRVNRYFKALDQLAIADRATWLPEAGPSVLGSYLAVMLRWAAFLSAEGDGWFDLAAYPFLQALAEAQEQRPAAQRAAAAEELGPTPFSQPIDAPVA